jgi:hypothetical protein
MSDSHAFIRINTNTTETADRVSKYLAGHTRPDMEFEIPDEDNIDFDELEFLEIPEEVDVAGTQITAWFEFIEEHDIQKLLKVIQGVNGFESAYALYGYEDYRVCYKFQDDRLKPIYTIEDDSKIDKQLWKMNWGAKALDWLIEHRG